MYRFKLSFFSLIIAVAFVAIMTSCSDDDCPTCENDPYAYETPKYVFLLIGDGMATPQINVTENLYGNLSLREFDVAGMSSTYAEDRYITGSAASATALATGYKTTIGTIAMNGSASQNYKTMAEMARDKGMKVGILSSVSIDHATPACFYAHADNRGKYNYIASQMASSGFDYFAGGFAKGDFQKYRDRAENPKDIIAEMQAAGYTITTNRSELNAAQPGTKVWAYTTYDGDGALNYELDRQASEVSLAEFTQKGIELLDNENGFFMMVEAGKVDWACHANDVVSAAKDMVAFDEVVKKVLDFYNQHPDETLIVVTGDHECGGLTLGWANTGYASAFDILQHQKTSYQIFSGMVNDWEESGNVTFEQALAEAKNHFGLGNGGLNEALALSEYELSRLEDAFNASMNGESVYPDEEQNLLYGYYDPFTVTITHLLNNKAGLDWTSYSHTGIPVPVLAKGQGQFMFSGYYDNTDIAKKIIEIAGLDD